MELRNFILIILLVLATQNYTYTQWVSQSSGTANDLYKVFLVNDQTGFCTGSSGKFIRTTNGGLYWQVLTVNPNLMINGMYFVNDLTGFISCQQFLFPPYYYYIYKTTDRGLNWQVSFSADSGRTAGIYFINSNTGYFGLSYCDTPSVTEIYRTTNQNQWFLIYTADACNINTMKFINNYGFWTGATNGNVYKTTNFGSSWVVQNVGYTDRLTDLHMFNDDTVIICGEGGKIFMTTNGGLNWSPISSGTSLDLVSISFPDNMTGYIQAESNYYIKSTNGGLTWLTYNTGHNNVMHSICFTNALTGFDVGTGGAILKTTTGGTIGIEPISNEIPDRFKICQNYPNPFNPSTQIRFDVPKKSFVMLLVYDALGREIELLVNEELKAGEYSAEWNASNCPSGVYFCKLAAEGFVQTRKMILMK